MAFTGLYHTIQWFCNLFLLWASSFLKPEYLPVISSYVACKPDPFLGDGEMEFLGDSGGNMMKDN